MKLTRVRIRNFKGIRNLELLLKPGFNLLVGENGSGKTSILEAISVGLGGFVAGLSGVASRHFSISEIRNMYVRAGDNSLTKEEFLPIEVSLDAEIKNNPISWTRSRTSARASRSTIQPKDIANYAFNLSNSIDSELPLLAYESTARLWSQKRASKTNSVNSKYERTRGYADALIEPSNYKMLLNWIIKMEFATFKRQQIIAEYEATKRLVSKFMSLMNGENSECIVDFDSQTWEVIYSENGVILPVASLSSGYQSLIWMVFDLAYRMAILNPHLGARIGEAAGVVLIDELDMHLHSKWQWNVIRALTSVFPNVQFIAATHSPILIASATAVNVINLGKMNVTNRESIYGLDVNETVESFLGTSSVAPAIKEIVDRIEEAFDDFDLDKAREGIANLKDILGDDHPLPLKYATRLDFESFNLER